MKRNKKEVFNILVNKLKKLLDLCEYEGCCEDQYAIITINDVGKEIKVCKKHLEFFR